MSNANTIAVQSGDAVLNGRHVHLTGTTTATVQSAPKARNATISRCFATRRTPPPAWKPAQSWSLKGTPTTGTPGGSGPQHRQYPRRVATHDMLLYRIPINGITVGTLVPLFNVLKP